MGIVRTRTALADALARVSRSSKFFGSAAVKKASTILTPTEHVVALAFGTLGSAMGVLVLTTERLVFFDQGFKSQDLTEFAFGAIQSLGVSKRPTGETITIAIPGRPAEITAILHGEGEAFVAAFREVRAMREAPLPPVPPVAPPPQPQPAAHASILDRLRQLGELYQAGILTDAEFSAKKAKLPA